MLTIVTWLWGNEKYTFADVVKLRAGVKRHLEQPHRFVVMAENTCPVDDAEVHPIFGEDRGFLEIPGCFVRLRLFDTYFQKAIGAEDRIVSMDLDTVITGSLDILFNRPDQFVILHGANAANPCPYNGSLWMLRVGYRPDVWNTFSLDAAKAIDKYDFPDDQGWLAHKIDNAGAWHAGPRSGVYAFMKPGWPKGNDLPRDARMVVFPGWRSPTKFRHLPWIKEHWTSAVTV